MAAPHASASEGTEPGRVAVSHGNPWLAVALAALAALPYLPGLFSEYVHDDVLLIGRQPLLGRTDGLWALLQQTVWEGVGVDEGGSVPYWRPVFAFVLWAASLVSHEPYPHEFLQLFAHVAAALVAWRLARRLGLQDPYAFFVAWIFAVHPVHVENVAWISAAPGVYSGLLTLMAVERYAAWRECGSSRVPVAAALLFAAALLTKEYALVIWPLAVTIDLAAPLSGRGSAGRTRRDWLVPHLTFAAVVATWLAARVAIFDDPLGGLAGAHVHFGLEGTRALLVPFEFIGGSIALLAWPAELTLVRPIWPERGWGHPSMWPAFLAIAASVGALVFAARRGRGPAVTGLALMLASLVPFAVRTDKQGLFPVADRFLYVAAFGAALALGAASARVAPPRIAIGGLAAVAIALALRGAARVPDWNDELSLWSAEVKSSPEVMYPYPLLGRVYLERYRAELDPADLAAAHAAFETAQGIAERAARGEDVPLVWREDVSQANLGIAWFLIYEAQIDGFDDFSTALEFAARLVEAHPDRAENWVAMAVAEVGAKMRTEAQASLRRALELRPDYAEAHHNLGQLLVQMQQFGEGRRHLERALELRPGHLEDLIWSARANAEEGRTAPAQDLAERAEALHPTDPRPLVLLATLAARAQDPTRAYDLLERALAIDPEHAHAHAELGKVLLALGQREEALLALRRACEFGPNLFEPHYNLGALLLADGLREAALPALEQAYRVGEDPALRARLRGELAATLPIGGPADLNLAVIDVRRRDFAAAEAWVLRRLEADRDDVPALIVAAQSAEGLGRDAQALERLERALDLAPEAFQPRLELARYLERKGERSAAAQAYRAALARLPAVAPEQEAGAQALREELKDRIQQLDS